MVAALSESLGRPVRLATSDPDDISSEDMRAMFGFLARGGYTVNIAELRSRYPQVGWQSFTDWIDTDLRPLLS